MLLEYLRNYTQFYTYVVIVVHLMDSVITFIVWILFLDKLKVFFSFLAKLEILVSQDLTLRKIDIWLSKNWQILAIFSKKKAKKI